jgi:hypothetical protein
MTRDGFDRRIGAWLAELPALEPDTAQAHRIRERCRAALAGRARRADARRRTWQHVVAPVLVGGFSAIYIALIVSVALGTLPRG